MLLGLQVVPLRSLLDAVWWVDDCKIVVYWVYAVLFRSSMRIEMEGRGSCIPPSRKAACHPHLGNWGSSRAETAQVKEASGDPVFKRMIWVREHKSQS